MTIAKKIALITGGKIRNEERETPLSFPGRRQRAHVRQRARRRQIRCDQVGSCPLICLSLNPRLWPAGQCAGRLYGVYGWCFAAVESAAWRSIDSKPTKNNRRPFDSLCSLRMTAFLGCAAGARFRCARLVSELAKIHRVPAMRGAGGAGFPASDPSYGKWLFVGAH
jgi:hypothetical protein